MVTNKCSYCTTTLCEGCQTVLKDKLRRTVSESTIIVDVGNQHNRYIKRFDDEWFDVLVKHDHESGKVVTWNITNEQPEYKEHEIIYHVQ